MASGETMVHDPLMTNASPMALHAMMPIVAAFMREVRETPRLTRHKMSDREPAVACDPGKRWMANIHNVDRRLARGSLHRLLRPFQVQRIEANGYFFLVKRTCPKRSILSPL